MSAATKNEMERLKEGRDAAIEQVVYWRERAVGAEKREQALEADVEILSELLRRMVAAMHAYEMDVDWDQPPPRDHRAMMADAYSAIEATSTTIIEETP